MKNEVLKIDSNDYGIDKKQANELIGNLPQIKSERSILEGQFDSIIKMDIKEKDTHIEAKKLRLLIQKNRTQGINIWHKTTKDYFLKGGQFVDAIKRKEAAINERMESDLLDIEKYAANQEIERLNKLQQDRVLRLSKYDDDAHIKRLSEMDEDVWIAYFESKKKEHFERIELEKKEEKDRLEKLESERIERDRIRLENIQLKKDRDAQIKREELDRIEREKVATERKVQEEKKQAKIDAELKKEREESEQLRLQEVAKLKKVEDELEAKGVKEQKLKDESEARIQAELKKGDAAKFEDLINDLGELKTKYVFKASKNKKMYSDVSLLIDKIINHIT